MNTYVSDVVQRYTNKGILIDANIALLYVVGSLAPSEIPDHGRTAGYSEDDFTRVSKFIEYFHVRITTPHILTEISDLLGNDLELHQVLRGFIAITDEVYERSLLLSESDPFIKIGLADAAILMAAKNTYLVLTDDGPLQQFLLSAGIDFVNLDQIRQV